MRFVFLAAFFLSACSGNSVPKGIFPPKQMSAILYDIVLADEWVDFTRMQDSSFLKFSKRGAIYDSIFQLHRIKKEDYQKSIAYYQGRPDLLKEVLDSVKTKADTTSVKRKPQRVIKQL